MEKYIQIKQSRRFAYLVGTGLLTLGIIVQIITHTVDYWLIVTMAGMAISYVGARVLLR